MVGKLEVICSKPDAFRVPHWTYCAIIGLWIVLTPVLAAFYARLPNSSDLALFDYIAWMNINGAPYYSGVAEQNWPGAMFIHELGIRVFGVHSWTFRLTDFFLLQIISFGGASLLWRSKFRLAPLLLPVIYPVLYIDAGVWLSGQRDIIAAGLLVIAAALTVGRCRGRLLGVAEYLLAGSITSLAVLTRPTYLSFLTGLIIIEFVGFKSDSKPGRSVVARCSLLLVGFFTPIVVILIAAYTIGSVNDWYEQSVLFNLQAYSSSRSRLTLIPSALTLALKTWRWVTLLALMGFALWIRREHFTRAQVLLSGATSAFILSYVVQNKGFVYHLGGLLPILAIMISISLDELLTLSCGSIQRTIRVKAMAVLLITSCLTAAVLAKKIYNQAPASIGVMQQDFSPMRDNSEGLSWNEIEQIVALIRRESEPDDYYLQWGRNFEVGFLAERRSSIRFVSSPALDLLSERFELTDQWLSEVHESLKLRPPKFVLIARELIDRDRAPFYAAKDSSAAFQMVLQTLESYDVALEMDAAILFRRQR